MSKSKPQGPSGALPTCPQAAIQIAVDTQYVVGQGGGDNLTTGVYLVDNEIENGSTGEGTMNLYTVVPTETFISWTAFPINPNTDDTVAITGFTVNQGPVFGSNGYPRQQPSGDWVGEAIDQGKQTYTIQLTITNGLGQTTSLEVDPGIHAKGPQDAK